MKRFLKIIIIVELIIFFVLILDFFIFELDYVSKEVYGICPDVTFNFNANESSLN